MSISNTEKQKILTDAKQWFSDVIIENHIRNTQKLKDENEFNINPFLAVYLANFLTGDSSAESIAKALVYPRALSTSITTSFGQNMQSFVSSVLSSYGSTTAGIDIEFMDQLDKQKRYCQLKAGPNTINKDDVETIAGHFTSVIHLARTNHVKLGFDNLTVGVLYGEPHRLNGHYKRITSQYHYPVLVGQDFWHRLTGSADFYADLISAIGSVAQSANYTAELDEVIQALAAQPQIKKLVDELSEAPTKVP